MKSPPNWRAFSLGGGGRSVGQQLLDVVRDRLRALAVLDEQAQVALRIEHVAAGGVIHGVVVGRAARHLAVEHLEEAMDKFAKVHAPTLAEVHDGKEPFSDVTRQCEVLKHGVLIDTFKLVFGLRYQIFVNIFKVGDGYVLLVIFIV